MKTRSHAHSPSALTLGGAPVKTAHEQLPAIQQKNIQGQEGSAQDVPSSPVVRTPHSHCQGLGSTPGQGTKTPQAAWHGQRPQRDLPAVLPIGLTLGWSPGGTAMVQHEKCHWDLPKWREYESQCPEPHTNVDLNHSKTDCHPQPCQRGSGIMQPLPTALQTPKTSRSTSETPHGKLKGQQWWGFRTKQGYLAHGHE